MTDTNLMGGKTSFWNSSTRIYIAFMGLLASFTAMIHGISEILQGNTPTGGPVLTTIGAISIIPNYLLTGIATIIVAISLAIWTIGFIQRKNGPTVFLILAVILFLVGGGVAIVAFIPLVWAVSTRINKPLAWWKKVFQGNLRKRLAELWPAIFITGSAILSVGIGIWLILLPPVTSHDISIINYICWTCVSIGFLSQILIIVSGFARDIEHSQNKVMRTVNEPQVGTAMQ